jgi:hypothetical protein
LTGFDWLVGGLPREGHPLFQIKALLGFGSVVLGKLFA